MYCTAKGNNANKINTSDSWNENLQKYQNIGIQAVLWPRLFKINFNKTKRSRYMEAEGS